MFICTVMCYVAGISTTSRWQWRFLSRLVWLPDWVWKSHWRILAWLGYSNNIEWLYFSFFSESRATCFIRLYVVCRGLAIFSQTMIDWTVTVSEGESHYDDCTWITLLQTRTHSNIPTGRTRPKWKLFCLWLLLLNIASPINAIKDRSKARNAIHKKIKHLSIRKLHKLQTIVNR